VPAELAGLIAAWRDREARLDYRAGIVAAVTAEANRDRKRRPDPFGPWDFFASIKRPGPRVMSQEEMARTLRQLHAAYGGELVDGQGRND